MCYYVKETGRKSKSWTERRKEGRKSMKRKKRNRQHTNNKCKVINSKTAQKKSKLKKVKKVGGTNEKKNPVE